MRRRRALALVAAVLVVAVVVVGAVAALSVARRTPQGQPALYVVGEIEPLADAFNRAPGPKLLVNLSPTCPVCASVADDVERVLEASPDDSLRVFVVWSRFLRWDRLGPTPSALRRLADKRVSQWWDSSGVAASALCSSPPALAGLCAQSPTLFGFVGWYAAGARWGDAPSWAGFDAVPPQLGKGKP
jgi:hypothetical protein